MTKRDTDCPFCNVNEPVLANDLAFIVYDTRPVNPGHALMIPKRPVASYFETTSEEREAMLVLLFAMREKRRMATTEYDHAPFGARGRL